MSNSTPTKITRNPRLHAIRKRLENAQTRSTPDVVIRTEDVTALLRIADILVEYNSLDYPCVLCLWTQGRGHDYDCPMRVFDDNAPGQGEGAEGA